MDHVRLPLVNRALLLLQPKSILEIGVGQGAFSTRLAQWGQYLGVENNPTDAAVAAARLSHFPDADFRKGGIEQVQPYETFDLVCAFEALENVESDIAALRLWAAHVNEYGSLIMSISTRNTRYERKGIKKLLAAAEMEEVSIHPYGAIGGHVVEWVSNKLFSQRLRSVQPNSVLIGKILVLVAVPMKILQRPFLHTSVGVGWVVVARRKRGAL